jgi:hypothetical protein
MNQIRHITFPLAICLYGSMMFFIHTSIKAEDLPDDVGLVMELSGHVTFWEKDRQDSPARAQAFMKIRDGDHFELKPGALIRLVYFSSARQETWTGPVMFTVGHSRSQAKTEEAAQIQPEVKILPVGAAKGIGRISSLLRRVGLNRAGIVQLRDAVIIRTAQRDALNEEEQFLMPLCDTQKP